MTKLTKAEKEVLKAYFHNTITSKEREIFFKLDFNGTVESIIKYLEKYK